MILSGDSFKPLEEQYNGMLCNEGIIKKILLPPETFDDAEKFLDLAGVNAFNFFPDHEGLRMKHEAQTRQTMMDAKNFYPRTERE